MFIGLLTDYGEITPWTPQFRAWGSYACLLHVLSKLTSVKLTYILTCFEDRNVMICNLFELEIQLPSTAQRTQRCSVS